MLSSGGSSEGEDRRHSVERRYGLVVVAVTGSPLVLVGARGDDQDSADAAYKGHGSLARR